MLLSEKTLHEIGSFFATYMGYKHFIVRSSEGSYHKEQSTYVFSVVEGMYVGWFIFEMCFNCCAINSFKGNDWRSFLRIVLIFIVSIFISEYAGNMKNNIQHQDWGHCSLRFPVIDNRKAA
jgi:hypothetical protein